MHLLHVLPRVPPSVCGVADYAWNLATELERLEAIKSHFLSAGTSWVDPGPEQRFPVHRLNRMTERAFATWMNQKGAEVDAVLLHLSPYGFQKRATPWGLARAWSWLAAEFPERKRAVYFHELFASGPPTTSSFWLQPLQKFILRRIARASSLRMTNRADYARWLDQQSLADSVPTEIIPVFSSLGELKEPSFLSDRPADMVFFTSTNHSRKPMQELLQRAAILARRLGLTRLHIIGEGQKNIPRMQGIELKQHGYLSPNQASDLLSRCRVGYTAYTPDYLGKSSLFASFAAHGLAVITQGQTSQLPDGLAHSQNVLCDPLMEDAAEPPQLDALQTLASALHLWYESHNQRQTATRIATALRSLTPKT
jgi:hypothetical protein